MSISELYSLYLAHPKVCTDTRNITAGCLFFALKGDNFDANEFASEALGKGAAFAVIDDASYKTSHQFILVEATLNTLQNLAKHHRQQLKIPFIGLTGSNGKTTTKELINSVLSETFKTSATKGNLNNHIGVPLSVLEIDNDIQLAIIEMGANHQKEIEMLSQICQPDFGLITNIGKAHLEGFGGIEGVKKGKGELYDFLQARDGTVFINEDSSALTEMASKRSFQKTVTYGTGNISKIKGELIDNNPCLRIKWTANNETHEVLSQLTGTYNFENILAAVAIGLEFGLTATQINKGVSNYAPKNNRSQITTTSKNTVIGDYYNANPSSMVLAIENISKLKADKKVLILGDMFEIGETADAEHLSVLQTAISYNFYQVILIGETFKKQSPNGNTVFFKTTPEATEYLKQNPISGALVLVKGSRGMKLETLMELL
ncbi:UDP-N-acetylmuramoyl-tripeptide--D-alanyl-D-alanine ligase [Pedobacter arcticus]|uniref:UDP-N-acetylmuramoyl-tripeptide--D-alanyl-D- alanine ligase n=1 Tax=Pedobacter arcticus TaxID=752140 RepID=UPI0002F21428|nr:UDP-N-acetylmuramoyl-tripeptide--D-alanyl-D-alanine ligase [Pedobacter arcticus]